MPRGRGRKRNQPPPSVPLSGVINGSGFLPAVLALIARIDGFAKLPEGATQPYSDWFMRLEEGTNSLGWR